MNFWRSDVGQDPLVMRGEFNASVDRVFQAWVEPEQLMRWFGGSDKHVLEAEVDLRVGGQYRFLLRDDERGRAWFEGEYTAVDAGARLAFTWCYTEAPPDGPVEQRYSSQVTLDFEALEGGRTRLSLRHEGLPDTGREQFAEGWTKSLRILSTLY